MVTVLLAPAVVSSPYGLPAGLVPFGQLGLGGQPPSIGAVTLQDLVA
jgi:hypothetical protein